LACNELNELANWVDTTFKGPNGVPGGVETNVLQIWANEERLEISWLSNSTVWLPNNKGSVAFLDPMYTFLDWNITVGVSILTPSIAFKLTVLLELNKIWSWVVLNTILPELMITCFPAYWLGDWGGLFYN
jgi:hypothetical protein